MIIIDAGWILSPEFAVLFAIGVVLLSSVALIRHVLARLRSWASPHAKDGTDEHEEERYI